MIARIALFAALAVLPTALQAVQPAPLLPARGFPLPYDLTGFVVEPRQASATRPVPARMPQPEPAPQQVAANAPLAAEAEGEDDTILLVYDLAGFLPPYPRRPTGEPLRYDLGGLLGAGSP